MNISTFDIKKRYDQYAKQRPIFSYFGKLTCAEFNDVLKAIEALLSRNLSSRGLKKKLFNVLIEITQNVFNYLGSTEIKERNAFFILLTESENNYKITTGNFLLSQEVPAIKSRIEMVNALDTKEIRELYRGILDIGILSNGGAGLGIIDIARKSGKKLSYNFEEIDTKFSFFTLEVTFLK